MYCVYKYYIFAFLLRLYYVIFFSIFLVLFDNLFHTLLYRFTVYFI